MDLDRDTAPQSAPVGSPQAEPEGSNDRTPSRRKLFKLAATAAPVLVAMSNRPAWACTPVVPSAFISVQLATEKGITLSQDASRKGSCGSGCSPTYWRGFFKGSSSWNKTKTACNNLPADTLKWRSCVGGSASAPNCQFGQLLHQYTGSNDCDFAAAYLSAINNNMATYCGISKYPLSTSDINAMYNGTYKVGGHTWTRAECIAYIQSLYDDSTARVGFNLAF
ncbi:MAG TPA: hypothetical protein VGV37_03990 [Aliidongia sp.]|uniref:hypothetical protein n=1 Tax=Aliidongia sp. TaxID=1914230 RepID=UPI002DDDAE06|nr:hypothetical protein [Aliidongia sp.]HEV2673677.1 hypothetical protein [Aliidongia sp.]